jgi:hypothetical protein
VPGRAAGTRDAHEEIAEAIVQPLDAFSDRRDLANGGGEVCIDITTGTADELTLWAVVASML